MAIAGLWSESQGPPRPRSRSQASCPRRDPRTGLVVLGAHVLRAPEPTQQVFGISAVIRHPDYQPDIHANDICLLLVSWGVGAGLWSGLSQASPMMAQWLRSKTSRRDPMSTQVRSHRSSALRASRILPAERHPGGLSSQHLRMLKPPGLCTGCGSLQVTAPTDTAWLSPPLNSLKSARVPPSQEGPSASCPCPHRLPSPSRWPTALGSPPPPPDLEDRGFYLPRGHLRPTGGLDIQKR